MDDLISKAAAIRIAEKYGCNNGSALGRHSGVADCIASEIDELPAVGIAPVVYGRWIRQMGSAFVYKCSACGFVFGGAEIAKYCPHCGAKMSKEDKHG